MENNSIVKQIIKNDLNSLNLQVILRDIALYLKLQHLTHYLPIQFWMRVNNTYFLDEEDVPAAIAAQAATNIASRVDTYPTRPVENAALLWKQFDADTKIAEREIKEISTVVEQMRKSMPMDVRTNMDELQIITVEDIMNYWLRPQVYGTVSEEQKIQEFDKLMLPIMMPKSESEKEKSIQVVDSNFTNFVNSCLPDATEQTKQFLRKLSLSKCAFATAEYSSALEYSLSLMNATYTNEELATTIKNVLRNHKINGNNHVNVTKSIKPKNKGLDPDAICVLHPEAKHTNKNCYTQQNAKAAAKEKRDKAKSSSKASKANVSKETESSDTD